VLLYKTLDTRGWPHLPGTGGWLDQDEALMEDLATLSQLAYVLEAHIEVDEKLGDDG